MDAKERLMHKSDKYKFRVLRDKSHTALFALTHTILIHFLQD